MPVDRRGRPGHVLVHRNVGQLDRLAGPQGGTARVLWAEPSRPITSTPSRRRRRRAPERHIHGLRPDARARTLTIQATGAGVVVDAFDVTPPGCRPRLPPAIDGTPKRTACVLFTSYEFIYLFLPATVLLFFSSFVDRAADPGRGVVGTRLGVLLRLLEPALHPAAARLHRGELPHGARNSVAARPGALKRGAACFSPGR